MNSIFDEYIRYAGPKLRISDQEVILIIYFVKFYFIVYINSIINIHEINLY